MEYSTRLQIFDAQINDSGIYTCEATKDDKKQDNTSTILKVFGKENISWRVVYGSRVVGQ